LSQTEKAHSTDADRSNDNSKLGHTTATTLFTDFDGKFKGRLSAVIPAHITSVSENASISARYDCRMKTEYHKDIMSLLEEGMVLAVKNFKTKLDQNKDNERFTLLVASRIWPDHYGLRAISEHT